jgi:hypothetical protein
MKPNPLNVKIMIAVTAAFAAGIGFMGCEISSSDETVRQVSLQIAGTYTNSSGIPTRQSGSAVTTLTLLQSGDRLEGIDNFGRRWEGNIGRADTRVATLTLEGQTTTGVPVVITGQIQVNGTTGTLSGIWVEPSLRANLSAEATVSAAPTPTPGPEATPTPGGGATPTPEPTPEITITTG